jgi:hypothetical protein
MDLSLLAQSSWLSCDTLKMRLFLSKRETTCWHGKHDTDLLVSYIPLHLRLHHDPR